MISSRSKSAEAGTTWRYIVVDEAHVYIQFPAQRSAIFFVGFVSESPVGGHRDHRNERHGRIWFFRLRRSSLPISSARVS